MKIFYLFIISLFLLTAGQAQILPPSGGSFGDHLVIGIVGTPPQTINPFQVNDITEKQLVRLIYGTGLFQGNDRFGQSSSIIEGYKFSSPHARPGHIFHYSLRRNVDYHNGIPMRNLDVKFTFDILKTWGGNILNRRLNFSNIEDIEIIGDLDVVFHLRQRNNFFDQTLYDIPILSQDYYEDLKNTGYEYFKNVYPMGYGPFMFERLQNQAIQLVSHSNYTFGPPFLNRIIFKFYPDEQQMIDDFIQQNCDLIELQEGLTGRRIYQILKDNVTIFRTPRPEKKVYFLLFNTNNIPFHNAKIRSAIRGSINQNDIIKNLVEMNAHIAYSVIDYTNPYFFKGLISEYYQPSLSLQILQTEGWQYNTTSGILEKEGKNLNFELLFEYNSFLEESIARAIKIHLAELGINVQPKPVSFLEKKRLVDQNRFMAVLDNFSYEDDDLYQVVKDFYFQVLKKEKGVSNYLNPLLERILREEDNTPVDRKTVIQRFQTTLYRENPVIFLYFDDKIIYAVNSRFQNIRSPVQIERVYFSRLMPFENWFVPKALQKYPLR